MIKMNSKNRFRSKRYRTVLSPSGIAVQIEVEVSTRELLSNEREEHFTAKLFPV